MGQVLVLGLVSGTIYGLFALGISLVYRGTGSINFALGEIGTISLFVAWFFVTEHGMPWIVGAVMALAVAVGIGVGFERLVIRHMINASKLSIAVATIGLLSLILAIEINFFEASPREIAPPIGGLGSQVFGVYVSPMQLVAMLVAVAVAVVLTVVLRRTDFGLGVLAAAQDPDASRLVGVPLARVSTFVWGTAAGLAALAALLILPTVHVFAPGFATELFVKAIIAAVVGGLTSLSGAFVGGLAVGLIEAGAQRLLSDVSLPGVSFLSLFVAVLLVLLLRPTGLFAAVRTRGAA